MVLSPLGHALSCLVVDNGQVPVVERIRMVGFGVDFGGHITPWCLRDLMLVQAVVHCRSRVGLAPHPGALFRAIYVGSTSLVMGSRVVRL